MAMTMATTALGATTRGWEALARAHREGFAGPLRHAYARYEIDDVTFLAPDVAIVHKLAWEADESGDRTGDHPAMSALYVIVERDGTWWIAARGNTLVAS